MRVLLYYAWSLDDPGGAELVVLALAEALVRRGHRVGVLETAATRTTRRRAHPFGGPVWTVTRPPRWRGPLRSWPSLLQSLVQFQRIVWEFKPDIVSVQIPARQSIPVVGAWTVPHKWRLAVTAHGSEINAPPPWLRPWQRRLFDRADTVTAVSRALWQEIVDRDPAVRQKGGVIHNGLDPSWFEGGEETRAAFGERYALFVGRFEPVKGADILLRAWQLLQAHTTEVPLWLAGEGGEQDNLHALSRQLGVAESLRFLGRVPRGELPPLYRGAAVVVMPSRSEGLPLVALEAGACGAICVATRVGGNPEVIEHDVTGFLAEPESPRSLADAVWRALQLSSEERHAMGAAAKRRIAREFTHERTASRYEDLFRSLLGPMRR